MQTEVYRCRRLHRQTVSGGLLSVEEVALLYRALRRLEMEGPLPASRKARFYRLTANGRKRLAKAREQWVEKAKGVNRLPRFCPFRRPRSSRTGFQHTGRPAWTR